MSDPTREEVEREYLARQYLAIARDHAGHIVVEQHGPNGEEPCTVADLIDAALATMPAQEGGGGKRVTDEESPTDVMQAAIEDFLDVIDNPGDDDDYVADTTAYRDAVASLRAALRALAASQEQRRG